MKNRHVIRSKDKKRYITLIKEKLNIEIPVKSKMEVAELDGFEVLIIDGSVDFIKKDVFLLTLPAISKYKPKSNFVIVDDGAIRFIANGADIMAPGIVEADEDIEKGDPVWVRDETHSIPLASGIALMDGKTMKEGKHGKAVENIHHVGDKLWKFLHERKKL